MLADMLASHTIEFDEDLYSVICREIEHTLQQRQGRVLQFQGHSLGINKESQVYEHALARDMIEFAIMQRGRSVF